MKSLIAIMLVLLPASVFAQTTLLGDITGDSSGNFNNKWKCIQFQAQNTGEVAECRAQFHSVTSFYKSITVGCAVYSDLNNRPSSLIASGCLEDMNFTELDSGDWIRMKLDTLGEGSIVTGRMYWVCFTDDSNSNFWLYRANDPPATTYRKLIAGDDEEPCYAHNSSYFSNAGEVTGSYNIVVVDSNIENEPCLGDFDCDGDVDGGDAFSFKQHFGRSSLWDECLTSADQPYCD